MHYEIIIEICIDLVELQNVITYDKKYKENEIYEKYNGFCFSDNYTTCHIHDGYVE